MTGPDPGPTGGGLLIAILYTVHLTVRGLQALIRRGFFTMPENSTPTPPRTTPKVENDVLLEGEAPRQGERHV